MPRVNATLQTGSSAATTVPKIRSQRGKEAEYLIAATEKAKAVPNRM